MKNLIPSSHEYKKLVWNTVVTPCTRTFDRLTTEKGDVVSISADPNGHNLELLTRA